MHAVTFHRYGGVEALALEELPLPEPGPGEVRVRVAYVGLNAYDWHQYTGRPWFMRTRFGFRVREPRTLGSDFSGTVDAVGEGVTDFAVGDRVFGGAGLGAMAERVVVRVDSIAVLPASVSHTQGASLTIAGFTALQALRDAGALTPGESVLVWGASGGVGHFAVQLARVLGADRVDAVCSGRNAAMMRELGADAVADYTRQELPAGTYDVVIDTAATHSLRALRQLLNPGARVVTVGGLGEGALLGPLVPILRRDIGARLARVNHTMFHASPDAQDLAALAALVADGRLRAVIHRVAELGQFRAACAELQDGHVAGKLLVAIDPSQP